MVKSIDRNWTQLRLVMLLNPVGEQSFNVGLWRCIGQWKWAAWGVDIEWGGVSCIGVGLLLSFFGDSIRNPSSSYSSCSEEAIDMAVRNSMSQSHYRGFRSRVRRWLWFFEGRKSCFRVLTTATISRWNLKINKEGGGMGSCSEGFVSRLTIVEECDVCYENFKI